MGLIETILERLFPPQPEPIAEVKPGRRVTLRGRVVARDLIDGPLAGARCVYYRYRAEAFRRSAVVGLGFDQGFWVILDQDEAIAEFYLQDDTGRAVIAPERAEVELGRGVTAERRARGVDQRASELRIEPGDLVEVEGESEAIDDLYDEARGYRDPAARLLLRAPEGAALRIRVLARG